MVRSFQEREHLEKTACPGGGTVREKGASSERLPKRQNSAGLPTRPDRLGGDIMRGKDSLGSRKVPGMALGGPRTLGFRGEL